MSISSRDSLEKHFEIIVVGSGPGGSVTAATLALRGKKVLLIEEGKFWNLQSCQPFSLEEMSQKYRQGGLTFTWGAPKISYVEGSCVGGGSEINSGLYHRTPPEILDEWARDYNLKQASSQDMDPFFKFCEDKVHVSTLPYPAPRSSEKLKEGAQKLGWKVVEVPRWYDFERNPQGSWSSLKRSMTRSFIPEFIHQGGSLVDQTRVLKIRTYRKNRGRFFEVMVRDLEKGQKKTFTAESVFLCCGAVHTPFLLLKSGLGRGVGRQLQVHPTLKLVADFESPIQDNLSEIPVHQVKEFAPDLSFGGSVNRPEHIALSVLNQRGSLSQFGTRAQNMAVYYAMIRPRTSGRIFRDPISSYPFISYSLSREDFLLLQKGAERLSDLLFASGCKRIYPTISDVEEPWTGPLLSGVMDFVDIKKRLQLMTIHLFSSCPMGENKKICPVNSFGEFHEHPGLFVNDASLLCSAPGVNPQGSIMAFAYRNALHFLDA